MFVFPKGKIYKKTLSCTKSYETHVWSYGTRASPALTWASPIGIQLSKGQVQIDSNLTNFLNHVKVINMAGWVVDALKEDVHNSQVSLLKKENAYIKGIEA